jgi:hypothetical protein
MGFGYKGLVNTGHEDEDGKINYGISNQLRLSSIPKNEKPFAIVIYIKMVIHNIVKIIKNIKSG